MLRHVATGLALAVWLVLLWLAASLIGHSGAGWWPVLVTTLGLWVACAVVSARMRP